MAVYEASNLEFALGFAVLAQRRSLDSLYCCSLSQMQGSHPEVAIAAIRDYAAKEHLSTMWIRA